MVTVAFVYNATVIPLRVAYPYQTANNLHYWLAMDILMDLVYWTDMLLVQPRCRFVHRGLIVVRFVGLIVVRFVGLNQMALFSC